ncbi:hypothetical protein HPB48_017788 [Haemaphysalis longicornis]|uniref:MADF domain-containing protein n=1 Tax=Haemaphysalis longicornis TaxID=44386 RepID=A0A9J6FU86_HAELO|nr:hypothetical protein HPB48_017788 [Haemaphysalis longicornis]
MHIDRENKFRRLQRGNMAKFNAEALVELVRPHRFLYDNRQPDFKDTELKENRWHLIGAELGLTGEDAAKKFGNMKDRWRRLKNTQEAAQTSGRGREEVPKITWRYFKIMDGLMAKERTGT